MGRQISFIENIVGPAETISGSWRQYAIDGCQVGLNVNDEKMVTGLSMDVSPSCTFEWRDMYHNLGNMTSPDRGTIGEFIEKVGLDHIQGCGSYCGNAARQGIYFLRKGSHADGWINLKVGLYVDNDLEVGRTEKFDNLIDTHIASDASTDFSKICDIREFEWAKATMGPLKIEYVEFGYDDSMSFTAGDEKDCQISFMQMMGS